MKIIECASCGESFWLNGSDSPPDQCPVCKSGHLGRYWECPDCELELLLLASDWVIEERERCPRCGTSDISFSPGEVVKVKADKEQRSFYGVVGHEIQAGVIGRKERVLSGPFVGRFVVFHVPCVTSRFRLCDPGAEIKVLNALPVGPHRRLRLVSWLWGGFELDPSTLEHLHPSELSGLFPDLEMPA